MRLINAVLLMLISHFHDRLGMVLVGPYLFDIAELS